MSASVSRQRAWQKRNPEKARAHYLFTSALRAGALSRPSSCEGCGASCVPHGHHDDYSAPLAVRWLCVACHAATHAAMAGAAAPVLGPIHNRRCARGFSKNRLALAAGTTPSHFAEIEEGRCIPGVDLALRIADALQCDVRELFPSRAA